METNSCRCVSSMVARGPALTPHTTLQGWTSYIILGGLRANLLVFLEDVEQKDHCPGLCGLVCLVENTLPLKGEG